MEWSKDKTMKLIRLLQVNASLWNPSLCYTRRDKQKRREELRNMSDILEVYVADVTRKIQHLRTQYNRESARELRAKFESPDDRYVSSWYAFEYLHFLKDSNKPYKVLQSEENSEPSSHIDSLSDCKHTPSPPHENSRMELSNTIKPEADPAPSRNRDDLSVFGEYVANELRTLKGEKNLLVAKKKILDVIFEVKMGNTFDLRPEPTVCTVFAQTPRHNSNSIHSDKVYTSPTITTAQIEPLSIHSDKVYTSPTITTAQIEPLSTTPSTGISEIIINSSCHYSNFKVDSQ